jgi:hypothetical protein
VHWEWRYTERYVEIFVLIAASRPLGDTHRRNGVIESGSNSMCSSLGTATLFPTVVILFTLPAAIYVGSDYFPLKKL